MLAVWIPEPGRFEVRDDLPVPEPRAGEVLVRVTASMVCATDRKVLEGRFAGVRYPHVPGHEWAGVVEATGPGVVGFRRGDRVGVEVHVGCGQCPPCREGLYNLCEHYGDPAWGHAHIGFTIPGGLAEYAAVPERSLHRLPEGVDDEAGAFTDNVGVALWAVERAGLRPGERVAVVGPGAIGLIALQVARLTAGRVVLVGTRPDRLRKGLELGADAVVDVRQEADPEAAVRRELGGRGADAAVEFAGTAQAASLAVGVVRRGGRVVLAGATGGDARLDVELPRIVRGHLDVLGSVANPRGVSERGLELMAAGRVRVAPLVTHRFPLRRFAEAWETFVQRRDGAIRVLLRPDAA
ncbi:MAG: alcohol dehydrogenase catalytic domain-containing protein [Bacillota bacterium]|nr:alcohol dehydrogenase catalytic domain-containing protein [Bacillota bacterium]